LLVALGFKRAGKLQVKTLLISSRLASRMGALPIPVKQGLQQAPCCAVITPASGYCHLPQSLPERRNGVKPGEKSSPASKCINAAACPARRFDVRPSS